MPDELTPVYARTTGVAIALGSGDHWAALTSTGTSLKYYVDGTLIDTVPFSMRPFRGVSLVDFYGLQDDAFGHVASTLLVDVRYDRTWQRVLTLTELNAEAASPTPISTTSLLTAVGMTGTSDLTDTVSGRDLTAENGPTTASGYVRFPYYDSNVNRTASWIDASLPFTLLFHFQISGAEEAFDAFYNLRVLGADMDFTAPYIWFGNWPEGSLTWAVEVLLPGTSDAPQLDIDTSIECCDTGGGGTNAGDVKRPSDPAWTPSCTGGGAVATASDLTVSEDWSA